MTNHKIVKLKVANVMRIKAASVTPDGNLIVVGGKNGNGKTSLIQAIAMALGGADAAPSQPIRQGEKNAQVVVELENLIVTRTFTPKGSYLKVTTKDGKEHKSPQKMLDDLVGKLTFDPLEFSRMDGRKQAETLRVLAGLDFTEADKQRKNYYDDRTIVKRDADTARVRMQGTPRHDDAPEAEVSVAKLAEQLQAAEEKNRGNEQCRLRRGNIQDAIEELDRQMGDMKQKMDELKARAQQNRKDAEVRAADLVEVEAEVYALEDIDTDAIKQEIRNAEDTNSKARENAAWQKSNAEYTAWIEEADALTAKIDQIDADKAKTLREAKLPIDGLGLDASEVTFDDIPFAQCSSAEQLRVSVAMGMAMNPSLRILMIRDGSLLDADSLAQVAAMAKDGDYQIWLEIVTDKPEEASVFIEDGMVKEE